jgi:hypothetical protein
MHVQYGARNIMEKKKRSTENMKTKEDWNKKNEKG